MSKFSLTSIGGGAFELRGRLDVSNVGRALSIGQKKFDPYDNIKIDVDQADCASTAGMALLLEWSIWSGSNGKQVSYTNASSRLMHLVELNGVEQLLQISSK